MTVDGVPSFQLVPFDDDDDLVDRLIEHNPEFRTMLQRRRKEKSISLEEAKKRLA